HDPHPQAPHGRLPGISQCGARSDPDEDRPAQVSRRLSRVLREDRHLHRHRCSRPGRKRSDRPSLHEDPAAHVALGSRPDGAMVNGSFSTLPELIDAAKESLPEPVWNWIAGGTSGEHSLVANQRAISDWYFHPENLTGAPPVDLTTEKFGLTTSLPVFVAPFGGDGSIHPERYLGVARALAATGNTSIVSETSTDSMEDVASALDGMQGMLQLSLL